MTSRNNTRAAAWHMTWFPQTADDLHKHEGMHLAHGKDLNALLAADPHKSEIVFVGTRGWNLTGSAPTSLVRLLRQKFALAAQNVRAD
ncbi:hypothetical protein [Arthrobacter sp. H5]|uniref:hypothetical protein n=1 Tax=Arthrobacter sp. H5 TaxID=1267973 RepID=UPI0012DEAF2C|nr:hypothetical protein [Arthrobacter sp. H5]